MCLRCKIEKEFCVNLRRCLINTSFVTILGASFTYCDQSLLGYSSRLATNDRSPLCQIQSYISSVCITGLPWRSNYISNSTSNLRDIEHGDKNSSHDTAFQAIQVSWSQSQVKSTREFKCLCWPAAAAIEADGEQPVVLEMQRNLIQALISCCRSIIEDAGIEGYFWLKQYCIKRYL